MNFTGRLSVIAGLISFAPMLWAQTNATAPAPAVLPGRGLAQHDFFYAGEGEHENMYLVRGGKLDWAHEDKVTKGEISDATRLSNGNILYAHQFGVSIVAPDETTPEKGLVWDYKVPASFEVHTAQAIGRDHVLFIQNGSPATLKVVNIRTGETNCEFPLPVRNPASTHGQFRRARLTAEGTVLVAHLDLGKIAEYDTTGKELWSYEVPSPWMAVELPNKNILITRERSFVREINRHGDTIWEFRPADLPEIKIASMQTAYRLANGNTLINSWHPKADGSGVQAFEVTPDKKLAWALRSWDEPDLGPSTTIQLLDEPGVPENVRFGDIK